MTNHFNCWAEQPPLSSEFLATKKRKKYTPTPATTPSLRSVTDHRFSGEAEGIFPRGLADSSGSSNSKKVPRVPRAKSRQPTVKANAPYLLDLTMKIIVSISFFQANFS